MARHVPEGYQLAPPDGGWSWVVLCGTVLIGLMISLPLAALGFIFNDIIVQMDTTAATAAWIPALTVSVSQVIAPFNTMIITRWSCRISFMIGGFLCALGLTLSFFATMVETLFVTFGIFVAHTSVHFLSDTRLQILSNPFRHLVLGLVQIGSASQALRASPFSGRDRAISFGTSLFGGVAVRLGETFQIAELQTLSRSVSPATLRKISFRPLAPTISFFRSVPKTRDHK